MKKLIFSIFIFIFLFNYNVFASTPTVVMESSSGRILYQNDSNSRHLIASITKIMTCIVTLENIDIDKTVEVGDEVLKMYGTNIYIEVGEKITIKDLLYGLMLRSGNDAAITLAVNVSGNEADFVRLMNEKAKEIGMANTTFSNPHGLDEETKNYSTAYDMSLLAKYAYKNSTYRKIINTKKYRCKSSLKSYLWYNRVTLLNNYKYCVGGKNGYTPSAGKTLVSYASKNNMSLIIVSLDDSDIYNRHEALYEKYFSLYKLYKLVDKNTFKFDKSLIIDDIYIKNSFYYPLKDTELENISTLVELDKVYTDNVCGKVIVKLNDKIIGNLKIYKKVAKEKKDISIFQKIINYFKN